MRLVDSEETMKLLQGVGYLVKSHAIDARGRHVESYLSARSITGRPDTLFMLARGIAHNLRHPKIDAIAAIYGDNAVLAAAVARELGVALAIMDLNSKGEPDFLEPTSRDIAHGVRMALVHVSLTDCPAVEVTRAINEYGELAAVGAVHNAKLTGWDFADLPGDLVTSLVDTPNPTLWTPNQCKETGPCSKGVPIALRPGYGKELQQSHAGADLVFA